MKRVLGEAIRARRDPDRDERAFSEAMRCAWFVCAAGGSLQQAFRQATSNVDGRVATACRDAAAALQMGDPFAHAMVRFAATCDLPVAELFARVAIEQHRHQSDPTRLLEAIHEVQRARLRTRDEARSATAEARFAARSVIAMPVLAVVGCVVVSPATVERIERLWWVLIPSMLLLALGIGLIRSSAKRAVRGQESSRSRNGVVAGVAASCVIGVALKSAAVAVLIAGVLAFVGVVRQRSRDARRKQLAITAEAHATQLLEMSLALVVAGVPPREVLQRSIEASPPDLRMHLISVLQQIDLGRSPQSALDECELLRSSFVLESWGEALLASAELGTPIEPALRALLSDARAADRERARRVAATAGPRIQMAVVFCVVPAILWGVLVVVSDGLLNTLRSSGVL